MQGVGDSPELVKESLYTFMSKGGHFLVISRSAVCHVTAWQPQVINCLSARTHLESVIRQHRIHTNGVE